MNSSTSWTTESVLTDISKTVLISLSTINDVYYANQQNSSISAISGSNNISSKSNLTFHSEASEDSSEIIKKCKEGLILPFWEYYDSTGLIVFHGLVYFFALLYAFVGVAIIADRFMLAIEQITSQETDVIVRKPNGEKEIVSVRIWNETVSNLTLMALGSSAPEILLSIIEIYAQNFRAGELGPGTIVGSAAFNMFVIIAICVWSVPSDKVKKIKHLRVFCITMAFSVFAYVWMLFILIWSTPGVIDIWEGFLTFMFFPITVLIAFIADRRLLIYKYLDKKYKMKSGRKAVYGGVETTYDGENLELTAVDANGVKLKVNDVEVKGDLKYIDASEEDLRQIEEQREEVIEILRDIKNKNPGASNQELEKLARNELVRLQPKSRAYYRIQAARKILGNVTEKVKDHFIKSLNDFEDDNEDEEKEQSIKIFFQPTEYTVMENVGTFTSTISRSGDLESSVLVEYNTDDGTAKAGSDYKAVKGVVNFGPGESHKQIAIEVINDDVFEEDEYFFIRLTNARYLSSPSIDDKRPEIRIIEPEAKVTILDDDHSGVFSFTNNVFQIPESVGECHIRVSRFCGARGQVSLPYKTIPGTAKSGQDFAMAEGKLVFNNNEAHKDIVVDIINNDNYEKNAIFYIEIDEPIRDDYAKSSGDDKGAPRLGELVKCMIRIRESRDFKATVDKLMRKSRAVSAISSSSWEEQFIEAITVPKLGSSRDEEIDADVEVRVVEKKSIVSYIVHYLTLFWRVLFAFVPPPHIYNGWACFVVSIIVIGLLTAVIGDLASHFGCTVGLKDQVTAISLVALGTSVPDTFASKFAAINDIYADSSIGNVTGSNAVNVFLGIGIAWTMAAIYHFLKGTKGGFQVAPGSLSYSVTIFCITAFIAAAVLLLRRSKVVGGELGGPMIYKLPTTLLFVGLWLFYVVMSSLEAYGVVPGF